ncbi:hypothetical protein V8F20_002921 [Naviculisporaceae sp. PSN 640]
MFNRLKTLVKQKTIPDDDLNFETSGLPFLPDPRPRHLTPSPSREDLKLHGSNLAAGTSESPFFQRLPEEIRRLILIAAFGDRIVHLDLDSADDEYRATRQPPPILRGEALRSRIDTKTLGHYGIFKEQRRFAVSDAGPPSRPLRAIESLNDLAALERSSDSDEGSSSRSFTYTLGKFKVKKKDTPQWEWWGSVCHRDVEWRMREDPRKRLLAEPWRDTCREGEACCDGWAGAIPDKCMVGVMGWLLSCRQAYVEGIEVLYATNTIHMASLPLILNLPKLLLPQRLAMITSLEVVWKFKAPFRSERGAASEEGGAEFREYLLRDKIILNKLLANINSNAFPNLRRLNISLMWDPIVGINHNGKEAAQRVMDEIVVPLDGMLRQFPSTLQECNVDILSSLFYTLESASWDGFYWRGFKCEPTGWHSKKRDQDGKYVYRSEWLDAGRLSCARIWRPLLPVGGGARKSKGEEQDMPEGYWICEGEDDYPPYGFAHVNPDWDPRNFYGHRRPRPRR